MTSPKGVNLLNSNDRDVVDFVFCPVIVELVVYLAGAEYKTTDIFRIVAPVIDDLLENGLLSEFLDVRYASRVGQQALWRHDDKRFAKLAGKLPAKNVKILCRGRQIYDLHILLGAELEKTLETRAAVLRTLPFVAVRQQHHEITPSLPFRFRRTDELINDHLRPISKITELRFPQHEGILAGHRVAVFKTQDCELGEVAVVDPQLLRLLIRNMIQRRVAPSRF